MIPEPWVIKYLEELAKQAKKEAERPRLEVPKNEPSN
jgi:hypothetical protein